ncbi:MAG: 6,7-dimethyl-8-ribityllumazine synthase [Chloroflexota bacterium]|nr:6,7-dimethyl-8-ribityllumazine synthase [Chloroflexota bacterium]
MASNQEPSPTDGEVIEPRLDGAGLSVGIVAARFNEFFTTHLLRACRRELRRHGVADEDVIVAWVPGAMELPITARELIASRDVDVVVCLGCIVRGETTHYDHVAQESARGIARAALDTGTPVIYGVVTAETLAHAVDRSGSRAGNRGGDAALAAIEMARVLAEVRQGRPVVPAAEL